ncbi:MAG: aminodeoxychorismate/anthranilate synthase component II [Bacteroidales bacterium]|nr:aminodeoxychorismate/anthranilate synthase component II [Bacteroidales bacterium]
MALILLLDNYDSFTYNLLHYVREFGRHKVEVFRNDQLMVEDVNKYDGIIVSPGPGLPSEAGNMPAIVKTYAKSKRIFGVCLGMQAIAEAFGGRLLNTRTVYHGVATPINICSPPHYIFQGIPSPFEGGRYHSWIVDRETLPDGLKIEATDSSNQIMALSSKNFDVCGVQFHPESILTPMGKQVVFNWLGQF